VTRTAEAVEDCGIDFAEAFRLINKTNEQGSLANNPTGRGY